MSVNWVAAPSSTWSLARNVNIGSVEVTLAASGRKAGTNKNVRLSISNSNHNAFQHQLGVCNGSLPPSRQTCSGSVHLHAWSVWRAQGGSINYTSSACGRHHDLSCICAYVCSSSVVEPMALAAVASLNFHVRSHAATPACVLAVRRLRRHYLHFASLRSTADGLSELSEE